MEKFLVPVKPSIDPPKPVKRWQLYHDTPFSSFTDSVSLGILNPLPNFDLKASVEEEHDRIGRPFGAEIPP